MPKVKQPRCPNCNSTQTQVLIRSDFSLRCYSCGEKSDSSVWREYNKTYNDLQQETKGKMA